MHQGTSYEKSAGARKIGNSTGTHTTEWQSTQGMLVSQSEKL